VVGSTGAEGTVGPDPPLPQPLRPRATQVTTVAAKVCALMMSEEAIGALRGMVQLRGNSML